MCHRRPGGDFSVRQCSYTFVHLTCRPCPTYTTPLHPSRCPLAYLSVHGQSPPLDTRRMGELIVVLLNPKKGIAGYNPTCIRCSQLCLPRSLRHTMSSMDGVVQRGFSLTPPLTLAWRNVLKRRSEGCGGVEGTIWKMTIFQWYLLRRFVLW